MSSSRLRSGGFAIASLFVASVAAATIAGAQGADDRKGPAPGDPRKTIPEKMEPGPLQSVPRQPNSQGGSDKETLSDELSRNNGVIRPPTQGIPDMQVPPPVPNPNTTPVIPPPGSPGNPAPVRPK